MSQFVTITKSEFEDMLNSIHRGTELVSGNEDTSCWEYVYEVPTSRDDVAVRIYSTVDKRSGHTRGKGEDAIRVVFWDTRNDRPVGKGKKILRVEGATTIQDRIKARVNDFLNNAHGVSIIDFGYVRAVLEANSGANFARKLLENLDQWGSLTDNQLAYVLGDKTPKGWDTFEAKAKKDNPTFLEDYMAANGEDDPDSPEGNDGGQNGPSGAPSGPSGGRTPVAGASGPTVVPGGTTSVIEQQEQTSQPIYGGLRGTAQYPYWQYPFKEFNPVQTATLPYAHQTCNLIIGANTSAGKTICAELLMDHILRQEHHNRVIYLSPLKSLTQEKYEDWQKRYPEHEITILTGDYTLSEAMKAKLAKSHIIVMTSEMCDSRTRRMHSEKNYWLREVGLVIVDESHILSTGRGHAVESGIMRFTRINKAARVLFLSATMPNCDELAQWVTKLNDRPTEVVFSTWRPVALEMHYMGHRVADRDYWATQEYKRRMAVDIVMGRHPAAAGKATEKFLVFCHDKGTGRNIVKRLEQEGVAAHFHNADLDMAERLGIEASFADRSNGLRVLVSTSTLAWGRNLPARNVVIVGVNRGLSEVDELDIIQMAGRAGRYGIDPAGTVYLLCPEGSERTWEHTFKNPRPVTSVLNSREVMAFHVLAEVENREIKSVRDLLKWYQRSLAGHQSLKPFELEDAQDLFDDLRDMEMLETKGDNYMHPSITGLGRVSAWLYFSPYDVYDWYCNFNTYFDPATEQNDLTLAWALGDVTSNDWGYVPAELREQADEYAYQLRAKGVRTGGGICSAIAAHLLITGQKGTGTLRALMRQIVYDIRRQSQALGLIDSMYAKWQQDGLWQILPQRIMYGVTMDMVELTRVPGIGGATARKLFDRGITSIKALADEANFTVVLQVVTPAKAKAFAEAARSLTDEPPF
jgi:replicative superfamily II helicase